MNLYFVEALSRWENIYNLFRWNQPTKFLSKSLNSKPNHAKKLLTSSSKDGTVEWKMWDKLFFIQTASTAFSILG